MVHHHGRQAWSLGSRRGAADSFNSLLGGDAERLLAESRADATNVYPAKPRIEPAKVVFLTKAICVRGGPRVAE